MQVAPEEAAVINSTFPSEVFSCICSRQTQQIKYFKKPTNHLQGHHLQSLACISKQYRAAF